MTKLARASAVDDSFSKGGSKRFSREALKGEMRGMQKCAQSRPNRRARTVAALWRNYSAKLNCAENCLLPSKRKYLRANERIPGASRLSGAHAGSHDKARETA